MTTGPGDGMSGPPGGDLTRNTLGGMKWTYGSTLAKASLQIGYTAAMGRLLDDNDFGLIAMAQIFLNLDQHLANAGVAPALVQKATVTRADIRVAATSSAVLGVLLATVIAASAPLAGAVLGTDRVITVVQVMALGLFLQTLGLTSTGLLTRELRFRTLAKVEVASHGIGYLAVGIGMAIAGFGVWSLVGAAIGSQALKTALAYGAARHPLTPLLRWKELKVLYGYGSRMSLLNFLEFIGLNLDVLVVGRFAGQGPLGQWNRASLLISLPFEYAIGGLSKVLFPTFSKIQGDRARVGRGYLGAVRLTAAFVGPAAAGMAVAGDQLVRVLLGSGWPQAAAILPWMALTGTMRMRSHFGGIVCDATAELNRKLALQVTYLVVLATGLFLARGEGLGTIAAVVSFAEVIRHLMYMRLMTYVVGTTWPEHRSVYLPPAATAAAVSLVLWSIGAGLVPTGASVVLVLLVQVGAGAAILLTSFRWGPLAPVRRELVGRLVGAGVLSSDRPAVQRLLHMIGGPR
ncbi:lipopolysaccharide biosynthesis protein [soil metagenome]